MDSMLALMERAGDSAINDLWHSVVQLVTNNPQLHAYAARKAAESLRRGASYEVFVKCTGYLLGEYGHLLAGGGDAAGTAGGAAGGEEVPLLEQFQLLQERFVAASPETKVSSCVGLLDEAVGWGCCMGGWMDGAEPGCCWWCCCGAAGHHALQYFCWSCCCCCRRCRPCRRRRRCCCCCC